MNARAPRLFAGGPGGFTMVEMLVAVAILLVLAGLGIALPSRLGLLAKDTQTSGGKQELARAAFDNVFRDIRQAGDGLPEAIPAILPGSNGTTLRTVVGLPDHTPRTLSTSFDLNSSPITTSATQPLDVGPNPGADFSAGDLVFVVAGNDYFNAVVTHMASGQMFVRRPDTGVALWSPNAARLYPAGRTTVVKYRQIVYALQNGPGTGTHTGRLVRQITPGPAAAATLVSGLHGTSAVFNYLPALTPPDPTKAETVTVSLDVGPEKFLKETKPVSEVALKKRHSIKLNLSSTGAGYNTSRPVKFRKHADGAINGYVGGCFSGTPSDMCDDTGGTPSPRRGGVFITDQYGNMTGEFIDVQTWARTTGGFPNAVFSPAGLTFGPEGDLFVTSFNNVFYNPSKKGGVVRIRADAVTGKVGPGSSIEFIVRPDQGEAANTAGYDGIAVGADNNLYVLPWGSGSVDHRLRLWRFSGPSYAHPANPIFYSDVGTFSSRDITLGPDGNLYITWNNSDAQGKISRVTLASGYASMELIAINIPYARKIVFKNDGDLYIASRQWGGGITVNQGRIFRIRRNELATYAGTPIDLATPIPPAAINRERVPYGPDLTYLLPDGSPPLTLSLTEGITVTPDRNALAVISRGDQRLIIIDDYKKPDIAYFIPGATVEEDSAGLVAY